MTAERPLLLLVGAATAGAAAWWRTHPSPCPYGQRFWVQAPHPIITRKRLLEILTPTPGEHLLEIGPGTGYYSLPVAQALQPGSLHILDIQQQMLDHTSAAHASEASPTSSPPSPTHRISPSPTAPSTASSSRPRSARSPIPTKRSGRSRGC